MLNSHENKMVVMGEIDDANELFLKKRFADAIKKYEDVLQIEPDNLIALNNKGYSLSKLKKYSEALSCYDESLRKNPKDKTVLINKISTFRKIGEFDNAVDMCDQLLENNQNDKIVLYHKMRILKELQRFSESNIICSKLLSAYPANGEVLYDMALNFLKIGDEINFFSTLQKAVTEMPNLKNKSKNNTEFKKFHKNERFLKIIYE